MKILRHICVIAAMSLSTNVSAADKPYKKDFSEAINEYAIVVVTTRADYLVMSLIDLAENRFESTNHRQLFSFAGTKQSRKKYKHENANDNGFYVRYIPVGTYAYTSSDYSTVRGNRVYRSSSCQSDGTPVFEFAAGNIYYFNPHDKFKNSAAQLSAIKNGAVGFTADKAEALNWLDNYFQTEFGYKEKVKLAESIGDVKFEGAAKRALGFFGSKNIRCPAGKDFVFLPAEK